MPNSVPTIHEYAQTADDDAIQAVQVHEALMVILRPVVHELEGLGYSEGALISSMIVGAIAQIIAEEV
jgi:hypothetical protein